jgi:transcriptional regulator with XRE-family HTH domain
MARAAAGMTQLRLAQLAGVSQTTVSRVERARRRPGWDLAALLTAAVGHSLSIKLYPSRTVSLRDSGQMGIAELIVGAAHPSWHVEVEAPVGGHDRRAADLVLRGPDQVILIEIERRLVDFQAQVRAAQLKRRDLAHGDERPVRLVMAVPDTRSARRLLAMHETLFRRALPVPSRQVWSAVRGGSRLAGDGVLLVSMRRPPRARG